VVPASKPSCTRSTYKVVSGSGIVAKHRHFIKGAGLTHSRDDLGDKNVLTEAFFLEEIESAKSRAGVSKGEKVSKRGGGR
jgi:hypothetical protein